jgi:hypothetical protein
MRERRTKSELALRMEHRAIRLLEGWAESVEPFWNPVEGDSALGCYGPGYMHWGVQSNWNYAAAMATLAAQPTTRDPAKWRARAVAALRFVLATHRTGRRPGNDGKPWGNSWISILGIERAMHAMPHLAPALADEDRSALRRLLVDEADWLLLHATRGDFTGVAAGMWARDGCNNPESNVWSGAFLWRIASLYPEEANASAWEERAHCFLVNGVSVEADAAASACLAGRPVSDWHVGANFFPHYGLDHHGYMNVGYMVITASNAAILHFDLKRAGIQPPESLYHHQGDLWQVLRRMIFGDGRLARIGGDSRVRYAYCQEYLLPSLLFAADHLRDPHALALAGRQLELMEKETAASDDGTFYGRRIAPMRRGNPHYFTRLESDRACVLAMLLNDLPLVQPPASPDGSFEESVAGGWMEEAHGSVMHRSPGRFCSFAWRAHGLSQALCLPPGDGSLAEWSLNLCPVVRFMGDDGSEPEKHRRLLDCRLRSFDGGFVTCGSVMEGVDVTFDEWVTCTDQALTRQAFAALPDGRTCLCLQQVTAAADRVGYLAELRDLHLVVPNDLFNGFRRTLWTASGQAWLDSPPAQDEVLALQSRWLNLDGRLGVVALSGGDTLQVHRSAARRAGKFGSLFVEEICLHTRSGMERCAPGQVLVDIGFALLSGASAEATSRVCGGVLPHMPESCRGIWVDGADGIRYALVANFGGEPQTVEVFGAKIAIGGGAAELLPMK